MPKADTDHTPTPPIHPYEDWPIGALEVANRDLATALAILGHLINSPDEVDKNTWQSVEDDLIDATAVIQQLWRMAWDRQLVERREHEAELEAAKAERAAPGSAKDAERVASLWELLSAVTATCARQCGEAGFPLPAVLLARKAEERT